MDGILVYDDTPKSKRIRAAMKEYNRLLDAGASFEECEAVLVEAGIWAGDES